MRVFKLIKKLLPDQFSLSWPLYQNMGCSREYWEYMRDNSEERLSLKEFAQECDNEIVYEKDYHNLVALLREKFRISTFDTDDHYELILRSLRLTLYALNDGAYIPTHQDMCDAVMDIEQFIDRYKQTHYSALDLARLNMIASMSPSDRERIVSMPSISHPVKYIELRSGAFRIESI